MEKLSRTLPNWSSLRRLGQSRVVALTALVPFIGTLILFNQHFVDLLVLSPDVVASWLGKPAEAATEASRSLTINRLVVTYFGLVFLGAASFLFALLCPAEIKRHEGALALIEAERPLITPARTALMVTQVTDDYLSNHGDGYEARGNEALRTLAYPVDLQLFFQEVVRQISQGSIEGEDADIYSVNGNIQIDNVARIVRAQRRMERGLWMSFHTEAQKYNTDLLALIYEAKDHSRPVMRAIISTLYAAGFLVLLYPTAVTLFQIIRRAMLG
ncbi:hypothetical protein [Bradyrhizobium sp.]|uniref:hypothetical protein n=1 Tax=Bradyrhizobium sp. TaxID=376 RepID=UPI0027363620|nr:hypothetical protein [Bradyrhizobium sp.]MDP3077100.1 hypothetical protein [Bradyrhizobium sp.]